MQVASKAFPLNLNRPSSRAASVAAAVLSGSNNIFRRNVPHNTCNGIRCVQPTQRQRNTLYGPEARMRLRIGKSRRRNWQSACHRREPPEALPKRAPCSIGVASVELESCRTCELAYVCLLAKLNSTASLSMLPAFRPPASLKDGILRRSCSIIGGADRARLSE
jgi:hypothetical protein